MEHIDCTVYTSTDLPGTKDDHSKLAQFSQPTGKYKEGSTLFVTDTVPRTVHIVTSGKSLLSYLKQGQLLFTAFGVHQEIAGSKLINLQESKLAREKVTNFFSIAIEVTRGLLQLKTKSLQGPHQSAAQKTIQSGGHILC